MKRRQRWWLTRILFPGVAGALVLGADVLAQSVGEKPTYVSPGGTRLRLLIDENELGGSEVEVGEITFAPGSDSGDHVHGVTKIFYVLAGELEHIVNGKSYLLKAGMIGYVRPPASVRHRVGNGAPAKALVIWAPGGEGNRIIQNWRREP